MLGGFQEVEVTQEHREILTGNQGVITQKLSINGSPELKITKVFQQIVNGKYFWFHLVDMKTGEEYSACVYQPNTGGVENLEVAITEKGHTEARNPN